MKRVVVTGIGAVTPIGNDVPTFRASLLEGKNGIAPIQAFDATPYPWQLAAEVKDFDAAVVLDKITARKTDPFVQFALAATQEAMNDSGIAGTLDPEELGVYYGSGIGGFQTLCAQHIALLEKGQRKVAPQFISKMIYNIAAGNIAIRFQAKGANMAISTACATGTTAIGEAYRAIAMGTQTAIICGGAEAAISPLALVGFGNAMALSSAKDPDAASLPFDARRGGFVMGEGAGTLILEEYEHAVARGAKIYAEVCGYGATCDAHHVTAPDPEATQVARAVTLACKDTADVDPSQIYVNAHGTGTALNDKTETIALKKAFGEDAKKLHISSTKSMTGHMLGAAGAVEAIAAILALQHQVIPPTINLKEADPELDLDYTPNVPVHTPVSLAISTSLGFGGHNACVAFQKVQA